MEIKKTSLSLIKLKKINIKCPTCKKASKEPFTPFCSRKCSDEDLMKWLLDDNYVDLAKK